MVTQQCCSNCGSANIVCNGRTAVGKQKYRCNTCKCYRTLGATQVYTEERREEILRVYEERASLRGVHRAYGVAVSTILDWLKKKSQNSRRS